LGGSAARCLIRGQHRHALRGETTKWERSARAGKGEPKKKQGKGVARYLSMPIGKKVETERGTWGGAQLRGGKQGNSSQ